jgi:LacI family transcriptional regulator
MIARPTMADVAREAGVSPSTASRVVHNAGYVSDENRERVLEALQKTGYRPNLQARGLRTQRSFTLGLVIDSVTNNVHFAHVAHALRMEAARQGYTLLTIDHEYSPAMEKDGLKYLLDHNVEAVIVSHPFRISNYKMLEGTAVRLIQLERFNLQQAHRVEIDPRRGFQEAIDHLVALNHREICYVSADPRGRSAPQTERSVELGRVQAFRAAVARAGLDPELCQVSTIPYDEGRAARDLQGYIFGKKLLSSPNRPSAVVMGTDVFAAGLLQAARELDLRIPDDLSVIGFDDSIAKFLSPPLSTIVQPLAAVAKRAIDMATSPDISDARYAHEVVEASFTIRQSTAPAPNPAPLPAKISLFSP